MVDIANIPTPTKEYPFVKFNYKGVSVTMRLSTVPARLCGADGETNYPFRIQETVCDINKWPIKPEVGFRYTDKWIEDYTATWAESARKVVRIKTGWFQENKWAWKETPREFLERAIREVMASIDYEERKLAKHRQLFEEM